MKKQFNGHYMDTRRYPLSDKWCCDIAHDAASVYDIAIRRGARVVEWAGLENRCALTGTVGSNPTPSARTAGIRDKGLGGREKGKRGCGSMKGVK